ncbi:MAG TPA: alpha-glycosidase [Clostridiales bacterium]|nr:alpha-glycosidase [Clostridiales bacterium]
MNMREMQFNSLSGRYKRPFGCLKQHQLCQLMVEVPKDCPLTHLEVVVECETGYALRVSFTREGESQDYWEYRTEFSLPRPGLYFYHFDVQLIHTSFTLYRAGETGLRANEGDSWQITCYPEDFNPPEDFQGAVMYQIFPDRFYRAGTCDLQGKLQPYWVHEQWGETPHYLPDANGEILNNDFFGGNLKGIEKKLNYLASLGTDVIYLNPICMGFSNHRYDTADYKRVDPMLGTDQDFADLCAAAHALGMKVVLDGVFSHTGSNSVYFDKNHLFGNGAVSNPNSPYRSWYDFQHYPDQYTSWWGIATLPCVNEMDDSFLDYIVRDANSVIAHWMGLGADGFRLDVADELPDAFIAAFRKRLKELNPDAWLIGEVWEDASNKISYGVRRQYFSAGELDGVMNYPFRNAILGFMSNSDGDAFRRQIMSIVEHYPAPVLHSVMNSLSTHDTPRILTLLGAPFHGSKEEKARHALAPEEREQAIRREQAAAMLQFTLPGSPCIYYGDEAGLEGHEDPFNRRCFPWGNEHIELMNFYRMLSRLKHTYHALRRGDIFFLPAPPQCICYIRQHQGSQIRVLVSGGQGCSVPRSGKVLLLHNGTASDDQVTLAPWGGVIIEEGERQQ